MSSPWLGGVTPRLTACKKDDIFGLGISVTKEEREFLKSSDKKTYYKVRENCVKGIENKFTQLKSIDENSPIDHFESVYSVVTRFDDLQESLRTNDMLDVFTIASEYNSDGSGPTKNAFPIDLFHNIKHTDLGLVKAASQYFMEYGDDFHGENVVWSGEKILNSCDSTLCDKLIESTRGWDTKHKGGPTYLKLLMGLIVATSEKSLRSLLDKVGKLKLSDFNGEDVNKAVSFLRGAILILQDNNALPNDFNTLVMKIFKSTSCDDFKSFVKLLEHNVELKVTKITIEETLRLFENKYTEMLGRNEWTPKSVTKDQESGFNANTGGTSTMMCFNCGGLGHGIKSCPQAINQTAIDIRKKLVLGSSSSGQGGNTNAPKDGKRKQKESKKNGGGGSTATGHRDPMKKPPGKNESHEKTINGKKLFWCGKQGCCKWGDHKSADHPGGSKPEGANHIEENIGDDNNGSSPQAHYLTGSSLTGF